MRSREEDFGKSFRESVQENGKGDKKGISTEGGRSGLPDEIETGRDQETV